MHEPRQPNYARYIGVMFTLAAFLLGTVVGVIIGVFVF